MLDWSKLRGNLPGMQPARFPCVPGPLPTFFLAGLTYAGLSPSALPMYITTPAPQAGRDSDWVSKETGKPADDDKVFAARVGIGFKVPEDLFG